MLENEDLAGLIDQQALAEFRQRARFDSSKMGYSSHIHNFLYRTFAQHGFTRIVYLW